MPENGKINPAMMGRLEREAIEEIAATRIGKAGACAITLTFLLTLALVFIVDARNIASLGKAEIQTSAIYSSDNKNAAGFIKKTFNNIIAFNSNLVSWKSTVENQLFEKSIVVKIMQPLGQAVLTSMGEGAKDVMVGKDGWLFHRPSFDLLTKKTANLSSNLNGPQASITAISELAKTLRERGISLTIMPVWPKLSVQPEYFVGPSEPKYNLVKPAWYESWSAEVKKTGAYLHDPADSIREAKAAQKGVAYLMTDSHWNSITMMTCARNLADDLVANKYITRGSHKSLAAERKITNEGDLARMLRLPDRWLNFTQEETLISEVRTGSKERWLPSRQSPVLLLGDSYSNIFSLKSMGWGEDGGFSEHLGANLGFPVDCILRNGDGAHATRAELSAELARGNDRLLGKKMVVWQFSASELTAGNWKPMTYQLGKRTNSEEYLEIAAGESHKTSATVTSMGPVPHPTSTVYKDYVGFFELEMISDTAHPMAKGTKVFAFGLVINDHKWTQLAGLRPGQKISVTLGSWVDAETEFGRHQRAEPDGELALQPPNWIRQVEPATEP